jgi:hypothetical protein
MNILIANIGNFGVKQTYKDLYIEQVDENTPAVLFFNSIYDKYPDYNFYLFLSKEFEFAKKDSVETIVEYMVNNNNFAGVYSDIYVIGKVRTILYLPAYDQALMKSNMIFNTPMAFARTCRPIFDSRIKHLHFNQVLLTMGQRYTFAHIPEPLFNMKQSSNINQQDIQLDMQIMSSLKGVK